MASAFPKTTSGKIYDPVFLFMLFAIVLAVGASFVLRATVIGYGPSAVHAAAPEDTPAVGKHSHNTVDDADH